MPLNGEVPIPRLVSLLRRDLEAARFSAESLVSLWGADAAAAERRAQRVPAIRATSGFAEQAPLAMLARFFVLGLPVPRPALEAALPSLGVDGVLALSLGAGDTVIRPLMELRPHSFVDSAGVGSWLIASDLGETVTGAALREDHVLGVGGASSTLASLMIHRQVESVLDLGTGCGIQALHSSRHARRVVATDISARALDIARLNARLNAVTNIEFRLGSLFDPVVGERFDHIVSNPPFVITPRLATVPAYEYRDGGMVGDDLVAAVIGGVAGHLTPGGIAQLLGNWEYRGEGNGLDRVGAWIDAVDGGLDAWVVEREVQDAALYAETWIRDGGTRPGPAFDTLYGAWLDDFATRDVRGVGFGYLTLRRPDSAALRGQESARLRRLESLPGRLGHNPSGLGEHLDSALAAHDALAATGDDALLLRHFEVAPDVTEERHYWPGAEDPTVMTLHQGGGFGRSVPLDTALAAFVGACDGDLAAAAIIDAIAQLLEADAAALRDELLPQLRELALTGFLR
ncbi:MAG: methyltransferase [Burkholderiaceae bacterium]|nr:methyltransferase [Microbacteriaceae bacterium]